MSILDFKGAAATAGLPVLYHLTSGQILYSETAKEDGESYVFDGDRTLILQVQQGGNGRQVNISMVKLSDGGFKSKIARVLKSAVVMVADVGELALTNKCHEALSGLVIPPGAVVN